MLSIDRVDVYYGNIQALWQASLRVDEGEVIAIVGSNGAGKSTVLRTASGLIKPRAGSILFLGQRIDSLGPDEIVRAGVSMVPEGRELFPRMTVRENLELGAAYIERAYVETGASLERVFELFPLLRERSRQLGGDAQRGRAADAGPIGRALDVAPQAPDVGRAVTGTRPPSRRGGLSRRPADQPRRGDDPSRGAKCPPEPRAWRSGRTFWSNGRIVMEGKGKELIAHKHVKEAYLGI